MILPSHFLVLFYSFENNDLENVVLFSLGSIYVSVQGKYYVYAYIAYGDLNTSYVSVQVMKKNVYVLLIKIFKYIICVGSSTLRSDT